MSGKKSLLVDKSKMPLAMGIAFVAFTTQFGGGFASGAQIYQYFINYGIWCLLMPLITQGLYALFFWYGMRYAYKHKTYDYRSFSDSLYGKTRPIMSNLYEICYLIMIGTASAAAFATGGSTLQMLFGIPYWVCTLIIAAFIFVIALFGTSVVRKCASTLSVLILIGLVLVLVPNIIVQWDAITAAISNLVSGKMPVISGESGAFGPALYSAVLYFFFQLASVSVMYQHMEPVTDKKQINKAAIEIFVFNFFAMELSIIGLLAVERRMRSEKERQNGHLVRNAIATLIFTFLAFAIAQFGLLAVVKQGYAYLGYAAFITLFIPFIIHVIVTKGKEI